MKLRWRIFAALVLVSSAKPQDLPPGVLLVSKIREHVREQFKHMPQYTCLETFERSRKSTGAKAEAAAQDTVRLEVLFTGRKEFYDFPGGATFKEDKPSAFVSGGLTGTGIFAGHLQSIFVDDQGIFTYRGEESLAGHPSVKYDFRVPILNSHYIMTTSKGRALVASRGTFWADPVSLDLIRLEVHADEVPAYLEIVDALTLVDYARTRIGQGDVLLPQTAELRMLDKAGEESLNRFEFTHCRSFESETSISFTEPAAPDPATAEPTRAQPKPPASRELPGGLTVTITLAAPLTDRAAVGELIEGTVTGNVTMRGKILIPAGAAVHGRIRRLEHSTAMGGYSIVALEFTGLEFAGNDATAAFSSRFFANLQRAAAIPGFELTNSDSRAPALPGVGIFFMRGLHFEIPKGWKMVWKTQALNQP